MAGHLTECTERETLLEQSGSAGHFISGNFRQLQFFKKTKIWFAASVLYLHVSVEGMRS
jgi:hypothetical protein